MFIYCLNLESVPINFFQQFPINKIIFPDLILIYLGRMIYKVVFSSTTLPSLIEWR